MTEIKKKEYWVSSIRGFFRSVSLLVGAILICSIVLLTACPDDVTEHHAQTISITNCNETINVTVPGPTVTHTVTITITAPPITP
ncbi:hypothetical protein ACFLYB_05365 [Chloroflexota bacterium]